MKNRKGILYVLLPLVITLGLYVVFNSRIECKPGSAGFWIILALGMSIGVAITRFAQWSDTKKTN
jgi:membrane protein CcdC involved in cytochrome C biogenesis